MPLCEAATARGGERNKIDFVVCIRTKNTACPLRPPVILTCWPEAMVKVVIGMAMGTACITPALEVGVTAEPGLLTSAVFIEEGEAVITLVAVVEPVPTVAATETAAASFPAHWTPVPELEMMVAKAAPPLVPGMMARVVPVYSGFSCGGLAMSMWSERPILGILAPFLDEVWMTMVLSEPDVWALGAGLHRDADLVWRLVRLTGMSISL